MNKGKHVFSQLLDFLGRNDFNYLARKYGGDKYVKQFTCYNQLCVLMSVSYPTVKVFEMLQIVSISPTDTTNLRDLFAKPNCNIVNELDDSTEPNLFNC